ncbi:MAG: ABC transporter permease subunit [Candidatus Abyssobacteria bacterium SURF_17]|uniref:ABC transporter permease subunit n=1 Tax=Candidatus Abyssobacteria bacterium SURF_17 TaxID=2093361 RepID=A0A419F5H6_9BACT|nr:MAG: ABC transporter permease subunit [Candidatus Abyssubacteria bacterium SURF_17]
MDYLSEAIKQSLWLIIHFDHELATIVWTSLRVSLTSTALASIVGVPLGFIIAVGRFKGKHHVEVALNTSMALPTVVVGLTVYSFISRRGPLGAYGLLFTPTAMVIGQFILATPIIVALSVSATKAIDARVGETARTLGANAVQTAAAILNEARYAILVAIVAGFGRVIAEVGSAMILGGNIAGYTRTMTTAIALETGKGEFSLAIALGIILLLIALSVNAVVQSFRLRGS